MAKEKPAFFSILPSSVRYDESINFRQKVLYSEITCLTHAYGYCTASNNYFSELYNVALETISRDISALANRGYLTVFVDPDKGNSRKIYLTGLEAKPTDEEIKRVLTRKSRPIDEKINTPLDHTVKYNSTSSNSKFNTTRIINKDLFEIPDYLNTPDFIRGVSMWAEANLQKNDRPLADLEIQAAIKAIAKYAKGDIKRAYAMIASNHETVYRKMYEPKTAPTPTSIPHKPQQETIKLSQPKQKAQ